MALGRFCGTTAGYDRKFNAPVITHINQTAEEKSVLEHNAHVEALETLAKDLRNCLEYTTDEKDKRHLAFKLDCTNQRLEQLRTEKSEWN
ncbi:hypothetical protein JK163_11805 [Levilactobacillus brevis]|uniref:Uncharacterized protein n=1 Tax=Levilactobacillus brevis TaxID=1580 RepID=A0AA41JUG6_LEVBR|nr:hypothetical protein [Levilactobacillus brevis]MBS0948351.1 hypothetical protein [Levilactobacillus brevis]MBS1006951.1 hypothetical protein [Levilactobacillus brevis]MBS1011496.1 hypothetical protein [Levilactobacillus brevis]